MARGVIRWRGDEYSVRSDGQRFYVDGDGEDAVLLEQMLNAYISAQFSGWYSPSPDNALWEWLLSQPEPLWGQAQVVRVEWTPVRYGELPEGAVY